MTWHPPDGHNKGKGSFDEPVAGGDVDAIRAALRTLSDIYYPDVATAQRAHKAIDTIEAAIRGDAGLDVERWERAMRRVGMPPGDGSSWLPYVKAVAAEYARLSQPDTETNR